MSAPLAVVASWNRPLAGSGVAALEQLTHRLPGWRGRLEILARHLEGTSPWSGPAGSAAARALLDLATAALAVTASLLESLAALQRVVQEADAAQQLAEDALALAAAEAIGFDTSARAAALAEEALGHAARADAAVGAAAAALARVGAVGALVPATFGDLADVLGLELPVPPPPVPGGGPDDVAQWWARLSPVSQRAAVEKEPERIGNLDGVPSWARDRANRLLLHRVLLDPRAAGSRVAAAVAGQLAEADGIGRPVQLYEFDSAAGLVAVVDGDLDTAGNVAVLVPGIRTAPEQDLAGMVADARQVSAAALAAAPASAATVATVAWLGYRTPRFPWEIVTTSDADRGGVALDGALRGLAATRGAGGGGRPRTTVVAHSYGTVVTGRAAERPGRLAADAVVLLGSPGMPFGGARRLEAPEVYDAWSPADPVSFLGWFGRSPQERSYGGVLLPTDPTTLHSSYLDPAHPTLAAVGRVVAGSAPR